MHSRVESNKITVLTANQRTLQDILTEGRRIIEETRDTTRIHIGGTQCVSRSTLLRILGEHVGRVVTDSLRLSSWMQHQTQYGDIAFADVILGVGATLPITFEVVEEGARRSGKTPSRRDWKMVREVFVAESDQQALDLSVGGMMGRMMREYFLPLLGQFGFLQYLKHDPSVPDSDVTPEYCAKHNWLIGSPKTVADKLEAVYNDVGGFGGLLVFGFDYADNPDVWHNSLRMLAQDVAPRIKHLTPPA